MKKLLLPLFIILGLLFCTVRIHAQTAQVSPVSNLSGSNSSVINNNEQILQVGINGIIGLFGQYFSNGILNTSSGGTGQNSSTWTSGDTVYLSSTGIWSHETVLNHGSIIYTVSGNWTAPTGIGFVNLSIMGPGGNGGSAASGGNNNGGGGGGGGSFCQNYYFGVTPGNTYTVTVGSAGAASSSFSTVVVPGGSNGGNGSNSGTSGSGGASGGAGNTTTPGTPNYIATQAGTSATNNNNVGGVGASTLYGTGGTAGTSAVGGAATGFGAGGGGAGATGGVGHAGGAGSPGFVIIQW